MIEVKEYKEAVATKDQVFSPMSVLGHEQVVFCHVHETGLKAIIAIHSTVLGPSLGGTRMWKYDNEQEALKALDLLKSKWHDKYHYAIKSWFDNLAAFFNFPAEIRKIIYTTKSIENLNRIIRKYTKTKTESLNENFAKKLFICLSLRLKKK
jgi:hypothetical protein